MEHGRNLDTVGDGEIQLASLFMLLLIERNVLASKKREDWLVKHPHELVAKLQRKAKEMASQLESLNMDTHDMLKTIQQRQSDRQTFSGSLLQAEEIAPLVDDSRQLMELLRTKRHCLQQFENGTAKEWGELQLLKKKLLTLETKEVEKQMAKAHSENMTAVGEMEAAYEEKQKLCNAMRKQFERVEQEVRLLQTRSSFKPSKPKRSMDKLLDDFVNSCCTSAGLKTSHCT